MASILIVEDEDVLRDVYVMLFKRQKYDVHEAMDGKDALLRLKGVKPDIIILDALMPVMGGIEFLESIDRKKDLPNTKILMLSNLSDPATISQSKKLGVNKYLLKASVSPSELIKTIDEMLHQ